MEGTRRRAGVMLSMQPTHAPARSAGLTTSGKPRSELRAGDEACCRGCMPPAPRTHGAPQLARHARGAKACAADARRRPRGVQGAGLGG